MNDRSSRPLMVGMKNGAATLEDSWQFLTTLNMLSPYQPAGVLLIITSPQELETCVHTKTCNGRL